MSRTKNQQPTNTLIASISGIRGIVGRGLDPVVLARYAGAFGAWARERAIAEGRQPVVVIGRDARVSGEVCARITAATLQSAGCDVIDAGLATTPTVEMAVLAEGAAAGIMLSASHNPAEWNALKLLNEKGEFLAPEEGEQVMQLAEEDTRWSTYDALGTYEQKDFLDHHIDEILTLDFIDPEAIAARDFRIVVDGINSVGAVALPALLERLGVCEEHITLLNGAPTGRFAHEAEPLADHLTGLMEKVRQTDADLGLAVDPDADRLAFVDETGAYLGEELTQVLCADFLWGFRDGPFVTNLSSSRAIDDVAARHGQTVHRSAVGEINVVKKMQAVGAPLGGEGNGGVILPDLHYGRDALAGTAMILQHLAEQECPLSTLGADLPHYVLVKTKLPLDGIVLDATELLDEMVHAYRNERTSTVDGLKVDFAEGWVHLRPSNTEPVLRIYAEASSTDAARTLADRFKAELQSLDSGPPSATGRATGG